METRRRGAGLEAAILDAAWAELTETGYARLTMAGVAARAGTSKPVVYRRWSGRAELVTAAIERRVPRLGGPPCTGDLRADVLAVLDSLIGALHGLRVVGDLDAELTTRLRHRAVDDATGQLTDVVAAAGYDPAAIGPHVLRLPAALIHHDLSGGTVTADPAAIVDETFLPLLRLRGAADQG